MGLIFLGLDKTLLKDALQNSSFIMLRKFGITIQNVYNED